MLDEFVIFAKQIEKGKEELAQYITKEQNRKYPELQPISPTLYEERVKMIDLYEDILFEDLEVALDKITKWGVETGTLCSELGMSIDMALDEVNYYRDAFSDMILTAAEEGGASLRHYHRTIGKLHRIIDQAAHSFSVAFVRHHNEMMEKAKKAVEELSVPVVPLDAGIAVLPIVGTLDTTRAKLLMEQSLKRSSKLGIRYFIMDLSGVPIVDTMVANQLFQVVNALKLLGVEAAITGIRPEIAQTMVALGINFQEVKTYASLRQALAAKHSRTAETQLDD
ncbi:STAS domain-containing protein [Mesobacillus foraminis]|uniref:STAS domain-containing protein n=1 Tax=Mesobacillus foraminis TaxID=279826 RepID=UPI001BE69540|nr:STAS domain-containing protein [Mesobacillus foraminis]MBT2756876.1 STAS domain-containing protein [Mesobacillus foraminis]